MSIVIGHNLLFQINQTSKVMQTFGVSLEVVKTEIEVTEEVLKKYCNNGYNSAVSCARKMPEALLISSGFTESRHRKKNSVCV